MDSHDVVESANKQAGLRVLVNDVKHPAAFPLSCIIGMNCDDTALVNDVKHPAAFPLSCMIGNVLKLKR